MTDFPMIPHQFELTFTQNSADVPLCSGSFSEVSGIEATMEPKVIREGGRYHGELQRAGQITYATVILKRGMTASDQLWKWFSLMGQGTTAARMDATLVQFAFERSGEGATARVEKKSRLTWHMTNALPVKFKAATYSATASDIGIEELHFVHEGLSLTVGGAA